MNTGLYKMISVGFNHHMILGMGVQPYEFTLPNSGIKFLMAPVIDLTGASDAFDALHIQVEQTITMNKVDFIKYYKRSSNIEDDVFIKEIIKVEDK